MKKRLPLKDLTSLGNGTGTQKSHTQDTQPKQVRLEGSRIVNLYKLQQYTDRLTHHSSNCNGSMVLCGEGRDGLASVLTAKCSTYGISFNLETSKKVKGPRGYYR